MYITFQITKQTNFVCNYLYNNIQSTRRKKNQVQNSNVIQSYRAKKKQNSNQPQHVKIVLYVLYANLKSIQYRNWMDSF
jgi:hypothetical protein